MLNTTPLALYIHWPFCKSKCPYCDFNSHVQSTVNYDEWLNAYLTELDYFTPHIADHIITSIFFGGGTPSLMPANLVSRLLDAIGKKLSVAADCEITLEANPTSVESATFPDFKQAGINRFSLGIQSFNDKELQFLGREHSSSEATRAIERVAACTDNYSFDLIYARPNQTPEDWSKELTQALSLACNHLSLYQLTIEKGTPFYSAYYKDHAFSLPDEESSLALHQVTEDIMQRHGFAAYEISNYAKPDFLCRHNLAYWRYQPYLGIGPGAHSRLTMDNKLHALMMIHHPTNWLNNVNMHGHGLQTTSALPDHEIAEEITLTGLRLAEGLPLDRYRQLCGHDYSHYLDKNTIDQLASQDFLFNKDNIITLTESGKMLMNSVVEKILR